MTQDFLRIWCQVMAFKALYCSCTTVLVITSGGYGGGGGARGGCAPPPPPIKAKEKSPADITYDCWGI